MESKFSHLSQRDNSVSMLRLKMSRRRSQAQKENRERTLNTRRQLEKLTELDVSSLDAPVAMTNTSVIPERTLNGTALAKKAALEERVKQLERWKERKALQKEKEKREKEHKGVFKTGLYHPKDRLVVLSLPQAPAASTRRKDIIEHTAPSHNTRVTRSMKQQLPLQTKPLKMQEPNTVAVKVQPVQRLTRTHAAAAKSASVQTKTKTETRTTRSKAMVNVVAPYSVTQKEHKEAANTVPPAVPTEPKERPCPASPLPPSEPDPSVMGQPQADSDAAQMPSFAPKGFTFQAPAGLIPYRFEPLTPRSADAFLTPSLSFRLPATPVLDFERRDVPNEPPQPQTPPCSPPVEAPPSPACTTEPQHDVPYFRAEIAAETNRLTSQCVHWEGRVEDESIPEEVRDGMRTAVGQARLLMKERFKQFSGLVDDCEFARGEKITTCTDLQGFWDMVYYQVEDVNKKFAALEEAESRAWVEERKPPPRPKRPVKKPSVAPVKPTGSKAAAKSRLAAVKAAMKAKQQAAETADSNAEGPQAEPGPTQSVVFDGGFFQVESPARPAVPAGSLRRSSRLSAVQPQASPCYLSPRRVTRRALALTPVPASPSQRSRTPSRPSQTPVQDPESVCGAPQSPPEKLAGKASLCFTPAEDALPGGCPLSPRASISVRLPAEAENTSAVEEIPGLDFEPYLQPSQRCSLSPRESVTMETLSPMAVDVVMESPRVQSEDLLPQQNADPGSGFSSASLHPEPEGPDTPICLSE